MDVFYIIVKIIVYNVKVIFIKYKFYKHLIIIALINKNFLQ